MNELDINRPMHPKKAFDRSLIMLLENEKIKIVGYDPSKDKRKVKQAFKSEPLIFDSSERLTRPEIQNLLNVMEDDDEAYQRIRERFKCRIKNLHTFYSSRWSFLNEGTFAVPPDHFEYIFSDFGFYEEIIDMISDLSEKEKEAYIEYYFVDSENADEDLYYDVDYRISNIIDDVESKKKEKEEKETRNEIKSYSSMSYLDDDYLDDEYLGEEYYTDYDLEELIKNMSSILILLDRYKEQKPAKVWLYPMYQFQFYDIWRNLIHDSFIKIYKDLTIDTLIDSSYTLKVDRHGYWDKEWALKEGGYKDYSKTLKSPNKAFEHTIDIIFTYPDEEKKILMNILAKGLSDEPDSLQVFAEFYKKINAVNYPKRLNNVLGIVSVDQTFR